ncbi:BRE1-domain-containing protein [Pilatotrama ljubarskyi]|nr:BRE1-domain-containing protein [Pilatotrama ljubarskyi]
MESRKRPHADDDELSRPKKRAVSGDRASPSHPNGAASHSDEPKDGDNVELFRKEAIYRRMKQYSREAERSQARVAELERRHMHCQAGLAALEACWTQLIGTIRALVKPEDLPSMQKESEGIQELTAHVSPEAEPEYVAALQHKMQDTADIVKAFVNLVSQRQAGPSDEETLRRCVNSEAENSALRSELSLVRTKLRDTESQKERFREELVAAEKHADRLQSSSLSANASKAKQETGESVSAESASSPHQPPAANGVHPSPSSDSWEDIAVARENKIQELEREILQSLQLKAIPEEVIRESSPYQVLWERASRLERTNQEAQIELNKTKEQLDVLQTARHEFEESMKATAEGALQELKTMLGKRDAEILRVREARDQYYAALNELRAKESAKASTSEFQSLAESRAERIAVLESENKRLKTRLAAKAGDEDLVAFFWSNSAEGSSYVDDLKRRLSDAEARAAALEKTVASLEDGRGDVAKLSQSEAELRRQVEQIQKQLEKYQAVYGDVSSLQPDTAQLSQHLQEKQAEIEKLQVQEKQREQAESALYSELDKLSAAWEALDRQVKSKVYDLASLEERVTRAGVERAKAENKYYTAVRDREALDHERKTLSRSLEKAGKALDKIAESEKTLSVRMHDLEKEVVQWRKIAEIQREQASTVVIENNDLRTRLNGERKTAEELRNAVNEHMVAIEKKRAELRKLEDSLLKSKKDLEKQAAKLKSLSSSSGSNAKEAELQSEIDKCMSLLKCSTCKMNMRNTVITKCMHSFCKSCVEARIATRQRKCPACNLPFSQGEVQQLYFQ